jgi:uncharacterized protein YutE (UPF0331/DUF86 family)
MTLKVSIDEKRKISELALEYQSHGYEVEFDATLPELPKSLKWFKPDLVARRGDETVILEVKSYAEISQNHKFAELVEYLNRLPGWRFEVVVVKPKTDRQRAKLELLNIKEINRLHSISAELTRTKNVSLGLIAIWISVEAMLRHLAKIGEVKLENQSTRYVLKKLLSYGLLSQKAYQSFNECLDYRNQLIHGYKPSQFDHAKVHALTQGIHGLTRALNKLARQKRILKSKKQLLQ